MSEQKTESVASAKPVAAPLEDFFREAGIVYVPATFRNVHYARVHESTGLYVRSRMHGDEGPDASQWTLVSIMDGRETRTSPFPCDPGQATLYLHALMGKKSEHTPDEDEPVET